MTVEASRAALAAGATDVVLFTDPDNPTSNALYQRIGYVHIADFAGYKFSPHRVARHDGQASAISKETTVPPKRLGPEYQEAAMESTRSRPRP